MTATKTPELHLLAEKSHFHAAIPIKFRFVLISINNSVFIVFSQNKENITGTGR